MDTPFAEKGYVCEICGTRFPDKNEHGTRVQQRSHLRPSFSVRFGNYFVAQLPRMCHDCFNDIYNDVVMVCKKDRSIKNEKPKTKVKARVPNPTIKGLPTA